MPATKRRIPAKPVSTQRPKKAGDQARFAAWLKDFDVRQAQLSAQLDAVLDSLGVNPNAERETV